MNPKAPSHNLPNLIIFPNAHFIHNTTPANAATDEIRGRLEKWFNNRPEVSDFKQLSMRFAYQCPVAFLGEVSWDGSDILFFSVSRLKKTMLAKYLEGGYLRALAADIGEARERVVRISLSHINPSSNQFPESRSIPCPIEGLSRKLQWSGTSLIMKSAKF